MDDGFGISLRPEPMPLSDQLLAQFAVVVYLPIEDDPYLAIFVRERLPTCRNVNDREPTHTDDGFSRNIMPLVVRSAVRNRTTHPVDQLTRFSRAHGHAQSNCSSNTTHC